MNQPPVILFDGICNLCCGWVQFLIRKDKKMLFRFASIQSDSGEKLLNSSALSKGNIDSIVYLKENQCFLESSAVLEILKDLGGMWGIVSLLKLIPQSIRNEIYRFVAKRRHRFFGKRVTCFLPTSNMQKRFLV